MLNLTMQEMIEKHNLTRKRIRNGHQLLASDNTVLFEARGRFSKVLSLTWKYLRNIDAASQVLINSKKGAHHEKS